MRNAGAGERRPLIIGCGALANELVELTRRAGLPAMDLTCLPASLHDRPERIPAAVARRIRRARDEGYDRIFVAYADCGTGGMLDPVLEAEGVARLEGAHCYEVYAGRAAFAALHDAEPGTFYLTDFLARNFQRLVVRGLGLDRHPELLPAYFGNYRRLVYLAQTQDEALTGLAEAAAARLGLAFERRFVGLGELGPAIARFAEGPFARTVEDTAAGHLASAAHSPGSEAPAGMPPAGFVRDAQGMDAAVPSSTETWQDSQEEGPISVERPKYVRHAQRPGQGWRPAQRNRPSGLAPASGETRRGSAAIAPPMRAASI
jgi:Protein of unknown function (DUF1638)